MTPSLKPSEVLEKAADLIEPEGRWTQEAFAKTRKGRTIGPVEVNATCWCMDGAVIAADSGGSSFRHWPFIKRAIDAENPIQWNDAPERTQAEVVKALRDAAELARGEGQ